MHSINPGILLVIAGFLLLPASAAFPLEILESDPAVVVQPEEKTGEEVETDEDKIQEEETIYDIRQRIEKAEKDRYELLRLLAYIYSTTDKNDEAIEMYQKALNVDPADRELVESLLDLYRKNQRWGDMVPIYEQFIEKYKVENEKYYEELVGLYFRVEQQEKAFALIEEYLDKHSGREETYLYAANIFAEHNKKEEILKTLQKGLEQIPDNFKLNKLAGHAYMQVEDYSKALEHFEAARALTSNSEDKEEIEKEIMVLYEKADIVKEIITKKGEELNKVELELRDLYIKQGEVKEKAGKISEALECYRKLSTLAPDTIEGKMAAKKIKELQMKLEER